MILFGWSMEIANEGRERPQWLHYIFGCIAGAVPWIVIFVTLLVSATEPGSRPIPGFVIAIFGDALHRLSTSSRSTSAAVQKVGRWRDYLYGDGLHAVQFDSEVAVGLAGLLRDAAA